MTSLLLKLFVKNSDDTGDPKVRTAYGVLSGIVGIICNALLCAGKLAVGFFSGSVSVIADAVNNLSDASSSVVTLIGFRLAAKPADEKHPFGHYRIEYFSGLAVAVMIVVIGVELIKSSIEKIINPEEVEFSVALAAVLVASMLVKGWMALFNRKLGKKIDSPALLATVADSRNDVITTAAVLASCIVGKVTGLRIDGYMGVIVALFIIWSGINIARDTISPLLGEAPDEGLVHALAEHIRRYDKILGIHDLIVHDFRMVRGTGHTNVIFDVVIPHEYEKCTDGLRELINETLKSDKMKYYAVVTFDSESFNDIHVT